MTETLLPVSEDGVSRLLKVAVHRPEEAKLNREFPKWWRHTGADWSPDNSSIADTADIAPANCLSNRSVFRRLMMTGTGERPVTACRCLLSW
ncbi:MAG TPA: hypothetical protein DCG12_07635 [Planctomycetaceae bacterium]|nr:hypothetical protein [Planctomycetaceae bacterium]